MEERVFEKFSHLFIKEYWFNQIDLREWTEKFIDWLRCNGQIVVYLSTQYTCGPHSSSIGVAVLSFPWCSHPDPEKVLNCIYDLIIGPVLLPSQVFSRICRVINQLKGKVTHSNHSNRKHVCRSIVLMKQDSLPQFSRLFWDDWLDCFRTGSKSWHSIPHW